MIDDPTPLHPACALPTEDLVAELAHRIKADDVTDEQVALLNGATVDRTVRKVLDETGRHDDEAAGGQPARGRLPRRHPRVVPRRLRLLRRALAEHLLRAAGQPVIENLAPAAVYLAAARAYCVSRFPYDAPYVGGEAGRESHIRWDAESTAEEPWLRVVVDAAVGLVRADG